MRCETRARRGELTRRANHRHIFIIARTAKARAGKPAAGFSFCDPRTEFPESDGGRISWAHHLPKQRIVARRASRRAAVRTIFEIGRCARTRRRRRGRGPRPHAASLAEIGVAPEMTVSIRSCRIFDSDRARPGMTAYLISLALAGLVAIAVWEGLS